MKFFDYFQIASVGIFLFIVVGKALYIRLTRNINPIAIGRGKSGGRLLLSWSPSPGFSFGDRDSIARLAPWLSGLSRMVGSAAD